jgi:pimeloyl-ACP methyl ester carboxylesterase
MDTLPPELTARSDAGASEMISPAAHLRTGAGAHGTARTVMGATLGWPWFDGVTETMLRYAFFKSSRLWAAAHVAGGSPQAFCDAVPMPRRMEDTGHLTGALARFEEARAAKQAIDAAWECAFFGASEGEGAALVGRRIAIETARLDASQHLNGTRRLFAAYLRRNIARVRAAPDSPAAIEAIYGAARTDFARFVASPAPMPAIQVSRAIPGTVGRDYWLRFASPSARLGDTVMARVHEPVGAIDPPTIILGHGVCIEFDHWRGLIDESDELVRLGFRVIRPEAPFHGRRTLPGTFGGEPIIGTFPSGALDAFTGALQEWAVLADWARRTSSGPLAFGGTSLGAQMAQLAAERSRGWPERLRPDALLLITHCGSLADAVLTGAIPRIFGVAPAVEAAGWTPETVSPYLSLLDPGRSPPIARERIVSVIGRSDTVTPFKSGEALIRDWRLAAENAFVWDRGHFSVPMTLIRNPAPIHRFADIVRAL